MANKDMDHGEKKQTWSLFVKLTQWSTVIVIALIILLAFFLL